MGIGIADVADDSGIADYVDTDESTVRDYKVMNTEYTDHDGNTVVHLFVRDNDDTLDHVEVVDHNPSFYIRGEAYDARVDNHYAVSHCETHDDSGERYTTLHGEPLVRVYTHTPDGVNDFREQFDDHYEADVLYTNRFLIDSGIHTGVRIDTSNTVEECYHGDYRVSYDAVEPLSVDATPTLDAKMLVFDIEVGSEDGVPSTDKADWPVTTIVAWDNYTEQYRGWMYAESEQHLEAVDKDETELDELTIYRDESEMLDAFNQFVRGERPDILTGWFSNDFDIPYVLNRCKNLNVYSYRDWSPLGDVYESKYEPVVKGVACVDMLGAYQKTQIHKLDSKKLDAIAEKELGKAKLDVDDGHTEMWRDDPTQFLEYNRVDVELVHRIDDESGATDLLDNLRAVVGCSWTDPIGGNIDMMDILFLRKAQEYGYVLPTAEKPEIGDFHGAYVYTPQAGLHEHVVYPDYSSLYPNMMYQCNISPETLVGTQSDLEQSDYDEDDCVWSYIDTSTQPSEKPDTEADEDDMEKVYFLKPSVQEGFIRSVLDDVMGLADEYTGGMYAAVKRVRNSTYGVVGDSDSYNRGFRLFDWRLAEATTLGGQRVLKEGGRQFATWIDDDAEVIYGDSVPSDEPVTVRDGIKAAEDVSVGDEVWTDDGWSAVKNVIEKPAEKQIYTVRTKRGVTHVTEDHGLLRPDGTEATPTDIDVGDELLHREATLSHGESDVSRHEAWAWGVFAAEGSCGVYDTEWGKKHSWAVSNQDESLLRCLGEVLPFDTSICEANENDDTHKLQLSGNGYGDNAIGKSVVDEWRDRHYSGDEKVVPTKILTAERGVKMAFLCGFHAGDGYMRDSVERSDFDELWSKSKILAHGLDILLTSLGYETTVSYRRNHDSEYYRVRVVEWHKGEVTTVTDVEPYDCDGDYVYDFETENHHFHAGVGDIIVHNTDSVVTTIPNADGPEDALSKARDAGERLNEYLDEYAADQFGLESEADARMEIEIETYARAIFFKGQNDGRADDGIKKRYVQATMWDDDDLWDVGGSKDQFELLIKGFEYVRSDIATVTKDVQEYIFETIMEHGNTDEAEELVKMFVSDEIRDAIGGQMDDSRLGVPFGISQNLSQYGQDGRGMPWYHGAKYANEYIYGGDAIGSGDKPLYYYIQEGITGDGNPRTFRADDAAQGDLVDCIAVQSADDLPNGMLIDRPTMVRKTIVDPIEAIVRTLGWGTEWLEQTIEDATPASYYRDESQSGLEAFEAM